MKYELIFGAALMALVTGCSQRDGAAMPVEKLLVVSAINPGELVAGMPSDISGKPISVYDTASVDVVNHTVMSKDLRWYLKRGDVAVIEGWSFVKPEAATADKTYIELASPDGRYYTIVGAHAPRPDVAKTYELANDQVGYQVTIKTGGIEPGAYRVAVLLLRESGVLRWESPARIIVDER